MPMILISLFTVAVVVVIGIMAARNSGPSGIDSGVQLADPVTDPAGRPVLIEYADFQCPACAAYYPLLKQLEKEYGGKYVFVYRYFPLSQHQWGRQTAYAAEAADKQEKFSAMHDLLYENQKDWADSTNAGDIFLGYAQKIGLNLEQYKTDIDSASVKDKVESDYQSGVRSGVNSTPTFFLNGKKIQPQSYEEFKQDMEQELHKTP